MHLRPRAAATQGRARAGVSGPLTPFLVQTPRSPPFPVVHAAIAQALHTLHNTPAVSVRRLAAVQGAITTPACNAPNPAAYRPCALSPPGVGCVRHCRMQVRKRVAAAQGRAWHRGQRRGLSRQHGSPTRRPCARLTLAAAYSCYRTQLQAKGAVAAAPCPGQPQLAESRAPAPPP